MEKNFDICWVCFPLREGLDGLRGELALARQEFLTNGRKPVRAGKNQTVKGFSGKLKGKLSRRSMFWKKKVAGASGGSVTLEEAFRVDEGWLVVVRDLHGAIVSRNYFDNAQRWMRSEYYEPWNSMVPRVMFAKTRGPGLVKRLDWDNERKEFHSSRLYPAPYRSGTAEQSVADAQFGQPLLVLLTTKGELCCCPQSQAQAREEAAASGTGGTMVLMPAWEVKEGELVRDEDGGQDVNITFTSLEEYAKIEPEEPEPEAVPESGAEEPAPQPEEGLEDGLPAEDDAPVSEEAPQAEPDGASGEAELESPDAPDPASNGPAVEEEGTEQPAGDASTDAPSDLEEPVTAMEEPAEPKETVEEAEAPEAAEEAESRVEMIESAPDGGTDSEGEAAEDLNGAEGLLETILVEAQVAGEALPTEPAPIVSQEEAAGGALTGRGRTQQPNGLTSYEGEYQNGRRHGFGAHYYKDGSLCYAGFWKDDRRDGLGVSFRDSDHAIHVAHWSDGQPDGLVALFDAQGSLRYSGRVENGKKEGAGVVINGQDGTVFVGQWSGGEATGLGSAFDKDGRLLYYGGWRNGKRHGHGTQFDENGGVIFDGEWRDDKYYNGVLYQKLSQPEWES